MQNYIDLAPNTSAITTPAARLTAALHELRAGGPGRELRELTPRAAVILDEAAEALSAATLLADSTARALLAKLVTSAAADGQDAERSELLLWAAELLVEFTGEETPSGLAPFAELAALLALHAQVGREDAEEFGTPLDGDAQVPEGTSLLLAGCITRIDPFLTQLSRPLADALAFAVQSQVAGR